MESSGVYWKPIYNLLEGANNKLSSVAQDVVSVSGRAMLEALIDGADDAQVRADLAKGRIRKKLPELEEALQGLIGPHQRLLRQSQLRHLDFTDQEVDQLNEEVATRIGPFDEVLIKLKAPALSVYPWNEQLRKPSAHLNRLIKNG